MRTRKNHKVQTSRRKSFLYQEHQRILRSSQNSGFSVMTWDTRKRHVPNSLCVSLCLSSCCLERPPPLRFQKTCPFPKPSRQIDFVSKPVLSLPVLIQAQTAAILPLTMMYAAASSCHSHLLLCRSSSS